MLVRERMIPRRECVKDDTPMQAVIEVYEQSSTQWLPVIDQEGHLLGMITPSRIQKAKTALANAGSNEAAALCARDFMKTEYLFVTEKTPIEEAVRMMVDFDMSEIPVVRDGFYYGVVTEKDMLRVLMEMTGARKQGLRLMVKMENINGKLLSLLELIRDQNGTVEGICTYCAPENENLIVTMRVDGVDKYSLKQGIKNLGFTVMDRR